MSANSRADAARREVGDTSPRFSPISREATAKGEADQLRRRLRESTDPAFVARQLGMRSQTGEAGIAKPEGQASPTVAQPSFCSSMDDDVIAMGDKPGPIQRPPPPDGRHRRKAESRRLILEACRVAMRGGNYRPSMAYVCKYAGRAMRTGFDVFPGIEALHLEAIADRETRVAIVDRLFGSLIEEANLDNIIRAIITGR